MRLNPTYFFKPKGQKTSYRIFEQVSRVSSTYYTQTTYNYPWVKTKESDLKKCYFDKNGYMKLSDRKLEVFEDDKYQYIPIEQISKLEGAEKKYIAPLVIGGIVAPLSMMAMFSGYFNFWIAISLVVTGLILFYYGVQGGFQIVIYGNMKNYQFFIDERTPQVEGFIKFTNAHLRNR